MRSKLERFHAKSAKDAKGKEGWTSNCNSSKSGKDAFHRVPEILFEKKQDAVERVLTGAV